MNLTHIDPRTLLSASRPELDPNSKKTRDLESLREYSREFEALFVNEMFKVMRKSIPEGGLFEKNMTTEIYQEMIDMEIARQASNGQGTGLGEAMFEQLKPILENKIER